MCTTGAQAAQAADACDDGVIICGYKFLDMMYSDLENYIPKYFDMIVLSSKKNYEEVRDSGVVCLSMTIKSMDFVNTVSLTIENNLWERKKVSLTILSIPTGNSLSPVIRKPKSSNVPIILYTADTAMKNSLLARGRS